MIGLIANFLGTQDKTATPPTDDRQTQGQTENGEQPEKRTDTGYTDDDIVNRLVDKFQRGEVQDDQIRILRKHLNFDKSDGIEVKLDHIRSKVADLEAYSEALEEFIDDQGTANEIFEEFRSDIATLNREIDEFSMRVESLEDGQESFRDRIDSLTEELSDLDEYARDLDGRHSREIMGVDAKIDRIEAAFDQNFDSAQSDIEELYRRTDPVESLRESISTIESDIEDLKQVETKIDEVNADIEDLEGDLTSIHTALQDLDQLRHKVDQLGSLRDRVDELETMSDDIDEIQDDLVDMKQFRNKLKDTVRTNSISSKSD